MAGCHCLPIYYQGTFVQSSFYDSTQKNTAINGSKGGTSMQRAKLFSVMGFPLLPQATRTEVCILRSILNSNPKHI